MKAILKCGKRNLEAESFFTERIFPILNFGIAIELSDSVITVSEKKEGGLTEKYIDPTVEVIVELLPEVILLAKDHKTDEELLRQASGDYFDEALAIRELEVIKRFFSVEYYCCSYSPANKV